MLRRFLTVAIAFIGLVFPSYALAQDNPYVSVPRIIKNMCHPDRFPDIYLLTKPHCAYIDEDDYTRLQRGERPKTVGHHGSPWADDRDIPLFFYGKGIRRGLLAGEAHLVDLAPTVAFLMGGQRPSASSGRVLHEILDPETAHWGPKERPKVVVLFSLDQCRRDNFGVFAEALHFLRKRIIANGAFFANAHLTYAMTATAISHTTAGTGAIPALHGIVGNNTMQKDGTFPLSIDDGNRHDGGYGDMSPKNVLVPTLADEIDIQYGNRCLVQASSNYARAAIGVAGHGAYYKAQHIGKSPDRDTVFAFNAYSGLPYTNTAFYRLPPCLDVKHNPQVHLKRWLATNYGIDVGSTRWTPNLSVIDRSPYAIGRGPIRTGKGHFPWGEKYDFNHPLTNPKEKEPYPLQRYHEYVQGKTPVTKRYLPTILTPFFELWAFDMNLKVMERDGVGRDTVPDFVFFHVKNLDKISHEYGVRSGELFDYLHYVDYLVQKVVHYLDRNVGKNAYTLAFFADHGGHDVHSGGKWINKNEVRKLLEKKFGEGIVREFTADEMWLDEAVLKRKNISVADIARWMELTFPWLLKAYTKNEVAK